MAQTQVSGVDKSYPQPFPNIFSNKVSFRLKCFVNLKIGKNSLFCTYNIKDFRGRGSDPSFPWGYIFQNSLPRKTCNAPPPGQGDSPGSSSPHSANSLRERVHHLILDSVGHVKIKLKIVVFHK